MLLPGRSRVWTLALVGAISSGAVGATVAPDRSPPGATVIMISMDGTRPEDVTMDTLPSVVALAKKGASADRLLPVAPTNTFPNHVTLVTGVSPARHGLVNNLFFDPERGFFERRNAEDWIEVEPIWSLVERQGLPSASFHWVGSEGKGKSGLGPRDWYPFSGRTQEMEKVEQILAWLDRPDAAHRPRLITAWFHGADHFGHRDGPGGSSVERSLRKQDLAISRLIRELEARDLFQTTTLIFVSDHGMAESERRVDLASALKEGGLQARVLGSGGFATVIRRGKSQDDPEAVNRIIEIAHQLGLEAFSQATVPPGSEFDNPRFGEVIVRARVGVAIAGPQVRARGFHGYAPAQPSMGALFVAAGPSVSPGTRLSEVRAIDVAPTILSLLGLRIPSWMEGAPIAALLPKTEASATIPLSVIPERSSSDR